MMYDDRQRYAEEERGGEAGREIPEKAEIYGREILFIAASFNRILHRLGDSDEGISVHNGVPLYLAG
jgi:hypothetical protein